MPARSSGAGDAAVSVGNVERREGKYKIVVDTFKIPSHGFSRGIALSVASDTVFITVQADQNKAPDIQLFACAIATMKFELLDSWGKEKDVNYDRYVRVGDLVYFATADGVKSRDIKTHIEKECLKHPLKREFGLFLFEDKLVCQYSDGTIHVFEPGGSGTDLSKKFPDLVPYRVIDKYLVGAVASGGLKGGADLVAVPLRDAPEKEGKALISRVNSESYPADVIWFHDSVAVASTTDDPKQFYFWGGCCGDDAQRIWSPAPAKYSEFGVPLQPNK